jgi:imidazole glycerol-phosphate synthase subunit HisH
MSKKEKVEIIDYQLGNLYSVKQACDTVGMNAKLTSKKEDILNASALILPGVGAFIEAMNNLNNLDLIDAIKYKVDNGTPLFGICLGLQLLFSKSEEFGSGSGLNLISGLIKKFPSKINNKKIKVPHISWNQVYKSKNLWEDTPLNALKNYDFMYFIHSYYVKPESDDCILTNTNYDGIEFCSSVVQNNILATQFHPEKSGDKGIFIYKNWALKNKLI